MRCGSKIRRGVAWPFAVDGTRGVLKTYVRTSYSACVCANVATDYVTWLRDITYDGWWTDRYESEVRTRRRRIQKCNAQYVIYSTRSRSRSAPALSNVSVNIIVAHFDLGGVAQTCLSSLYCYCPSRRISFTSSFVSFNPLNTRPSASTRIRYVRTYVTCRWWYDDLVDTASAISTFDIGDSFVPVPVPVPVTVSRIRKNARPTKVRLRRSIPYVTIKHFTSEWYCLYAYYTRARVNVCTCVTSTYALRWMLIRLGPHDTRYAFFVCNSWMCLKLILGEIFIRKNVQMYLCRVLLL